MRCSCCGEEVGNVALCPICGNALAAAPVVAAPAANAAATDPAAGAPHESLVSAAYDDGVNVFDRNVNGVMELTTRKGMNWFCGSGYLVNKDGFGITNSHVLVADGKLCNSCTALIAGEKVPVEVIALGTKHDLGTTKDVAVIKLGKVPAKATPIRFANSDKVRTGERVYIVGNSLGEGTCITSGIVSDNNREGLFMYDSATNGGNSGGPVFNAEGNVIATHVRGKLDGRGSKVQGMNCGIPCSFAKALLDANGVKYESD